MDGGSLTIPLFITFLVLKLTNVIHWSWWWVTAPLWISVATAVVFLIISLAFGWSFLAFVRRRGGL